MISLYGLEGVGFRAPTVPEIPNVAPEDCIPRRESQLIKDSGKDWPAPCKVSTNSKSLLVQGAVKKYRSLCGRPCNEESSKGSFEV